MIKTYERISIKLLQNQPKPKKKIWFDGRKIILGHKSLHKTPQSRRWRLFWRLKDK